MLFPLPPRPRCKCLSSFIGTAVARRSQAGRNVFICISQKFVMELFPCNSATTDVRLPSLSRKACCSLRCAFLCQCIESRSASLKRCYGESVGFRVGRCSFPQAQATAFGVTAPRICDISSNCAFQLVREWGLHIPPIFTASFGRAKRDS